MGLWLEPESNLVRHGLVHANSSPFNSNVDKKTIEKLYNDNFKMAEEKYLKNGEFRVKTYDHGITEALDEMLLFQFIIMDSSGLTTTEFRSAMSTNGIHETPEF